MQFHYSASGSGFRRKPAYTAVAAMSRSSPNFSTAANTFGYREFTAGCCDFISFIHSIGMCRM
jgi:hypothetical protein